MSDDTSSMMIQAFAPSYVFRGRHSSGEAATVCHEVHDGDTIRATLCLPCWTLSDQWLRLRGVACPELGEPGGRAAQAFVAGLVLGGPVWVRTFKRPSDDEERRSFVRLIADVGFDPDAAGHLRNLASEIVAHGHGIPWP